MAANILNGKFRKKEEIVSKVLEKGINVKIPVSFLKKNKNSFLFLDEMAAKKWRK